MVDLPSELWIRVASFMDTTSLCNLSATSRDLNELMYTAWMAKAKLTWGHWGHGWTVHVSPRAGKTLALTQAFLGAKITASASSALADATIAPRDATSFLLADGVAVSSQDHAQEGIDNTLNPSSTMTGWLIPQPCYWSSAGSLDPDTAHFLCYKLSTPCALVHRVGIRPFKATFQPGTPTYACKQMRVRVIAEVPTADKPWPSALYESSYFDMGSSDQLELVKLDPPVLVVGFLQLELIGCQAQQFQDQRFYTCISFAAALGCALPQLHLETLDPQSMNVHVRVGEQAPSVARLRQETGVRMLRQAFNDVISIDSFPELVLSALMVMLIPIIATVYSSYI